MHKIIVFDLDGTLAPVGLGTIPENVKKLKELENIGYTIAICSGKPSYYLCGFMRQLELDSPILIGENGATIQFGTALPPQKYLVHPHSAEAKKQIKDMKERIDSLLGEQIWYQPNQVGLTPFPNCEEHFDVISKLIEDNTEQLGELLIYRHCDSFDFSPKNISKYTGLELLSKQLGINASDFIAVGDGVNDVPMFDFSDVSIVIGDKLKYEADLRFATIDEALDHLLTSRI